MELLALLTVSLLQGSPGPTLCGTELLAEVEYIPAPTGTEQRRSCRASASNIFSFESLFCFCFKCGFPFFILTSVPPSQQEDPVVLSCLAFGLGLFQGSAGWRNI